SIALGVALGAAYVFDVSLALGAFFAGMILGETQLSRRAAEETLPLRDAFAVLFFVSVGMLFDPAVVVEQPGPVLATVAIIVIGKSLAAYAIVRAFGHDNEIALTVAGSLAQIGEFSFILAGLGMQLGILPPEGRDLILAGAIFSILFNPLIFTLAAGRLGDVKRQDEAKAQEREEARQRERREHVVRVGHGRVGRLIAEGAAHRGRALVVIEEQADFARQAEEAGREVVVGNASNPHILDEAGIQHASKLIIAIPEGFEGGAIAEHARRLNPEIVIFARAHSDEEVGYLERLGVDHVIMGEREIARAILGLAATSRPAA